MIFTFTWLTDWHTVYRIFQESFILTVMSFTCISMHFNVFAIHNSQFTELGSPATETALRQRINLAQEKQQVAQTKKKNVLFFGCFLHFQSADHCVFPSAPRPWRSLGCCPGHNSPPRCRPPGINSSGFPPVWKIPCIWKSSTFHLENKRGLPNQRKHQLNTASARVPKSKPGVSEQQPDVFLTILWQTCHLQTGLQTLSESGTLQNKTSNFFHVRVLQTQISIDFLKASKEMLDQVAYGSRQVTLHSLVDSRLKRDLFTQYHSVMHHLFVVYFFKALVMIYCTACIVHLSKTWSLKNLTCQLGCNICRTCFFPIKWTLFMSIATEKFEVLTATSHLPWLFHNAENATPLVEFLHSLHGKMDRIKSQTQKLQRNDKWLEKSKKSRERSFLTQKPHLTNTTTIWKVLFFERFLKSQNTTTNSMNFCSCTWFDSARVRQIWCSTSLKAATWSRARWLV